MNIREWTPLTIVSLSFMLLIWITALIGNILVVLSVIRFPRLRSQICFHFLASLAVADIAVSILVLPLSLLYFVFNYQWILPTVLCKQWISCDVMCCTASILHLVVIALDRHMAIVRPLRYPSIVTVKIVRVSVCLIWIISALISFIPINSGLATPGSLPNTTHCDLEVNSVYAALSSSTSFYIPFIAICVIYFKIFLVAKRQAALIHRERREDSQRLRHETKALKTLGMLVGCFAACWLPFFLMYSILPHCNNNCLDQDWVTLITWIGYTNSAINPCLYCFMQREFRASFRRLVCHPCQDSFSTYLGTGGRNVWATGNSEQCAASIPLKDDRRSTHLHLSGIHKRDGSTSELQK